MATVGADGKVNMAIYSRPRFLDANDDATVAFIMADRLSHANVQANPHAAYLFIEEGEGYQGRRLTLMRIKEETDPEMIQSVRRQQQLSEYKDDKKRFLVYFRVDGILPLTSTG